MKCRSVDIARSLARAGAIFAVGLATDPAHAAVETLDFSGYFLGGSVEPFPLFPATISGMVSYDTTNSGIVTPDQYTFVNSDLTTGSSAWYYNSVTKFAFHSVNAAPGSQITGMYFGGGAGAFVVYNNNSGLDALAASAFSSDGLTGIAPSGYQLTTAMCPPNAVRAIRTRRGSLRRPYVRLALPPNSDSRFPARQRAFW
jgi:hypothetical protein